MSDTKAKLIRIEYEDGSVREAVGEFAAKIMDHWIDCELFCANHGFLYSGPCLSEVRSPKKENEDPAK
jgi:hypothetical protein